MQYTQEGHNTGTFQERPSIEATWAWESAGPATQQVNPLHQSDSA